MNSLQQTAKAIGIFVLAMLSAAALVTVLVVAEDFVLLIFLGILFGVFLTKTSQFSNRFLSIGYGWNLALVTLLLLLVTAGGLALLGDKIHDRLQATSQKLDEGTDELVNRLERHPSLLQAFKRIPFAQELVLDEQSAQASEAEPSASEESQSEESQSQESNSEESKSQESNSEESNSEPSESEPQRGPEQGEPSQAGAQVAASAPASSGSAGQVSGPQAPAQSAGETGQFVRSTAGRVFSILDRILSTTLGLIANIGLIFFVGIFVAVDPGLYRDGFARLFPLNRRERVADILDRMGSAMFSWLMGRFMTMLITGAGTAMALFALGVPMALSVGVITGLLTFVPNIGAIIGLALAILLALPQGMATVGWVIGLYAALQLLESNVVTPLLQQQQTSIPPALLLSFQVVMGAVAGFLGLMVATPLLAASLVLIQQAWIKDVLGEPTRDC